MEEKDIAGELLLLVRNYGESAILQLYYRQYLREVKVKPKLILGLVGSPRKLGNCEVIIKEIARRIPYEHTLKLIRMPSLSIKPCSACYGCVMGKACPKKDDMDFLLDRIVESDGIIIASPVYFLGAHSIFKQITDRGFLFFRVVEKTFGKPCVLLNLYGMEERIGAAPQTLMSFASFLGLEIMESVTMKAALPGEILLNRETGIEAERLASRLFAEKGPLQGYGCPFCGCEIVKMEQKQFICTLCHGAFYYDKGHNIIRIKEGGVFGSLEHRLQHKEWLTSMKDEFLKKRKDILRTTLPYKEMGEWIEP
ncbi:MAG: hypothetical protein C0392_08520 [Syntrophus sp. (in: bacteria)]|nr:hypothetical protein [Syntrophus sp. (in: bacteria)]